MYSVNGCFVSKAKAQSMSILPSKSEKTIKLRDKHNKTHSENMSSAKERAPAMHLFKTRLK